MSSCVLPCILFRRRFSQQELPQFSIAPLIVLGRPRSFSVQYIYILKKIRFWRKCSPQCWRCDSHTTATTVLPATDFLLFFCLWFFLPTVCRICEFPSDSVDLDSRIRQKLEPLNDCAVQWTPRRKSLEEGTCSMCVITSISADTSWKRSSLREGYPLKMTLLAGQLGLSLGKFNRSQSKPRKQDQLWCRKRKNDNMYGISISISDCPLVECYRSVIIRFGQSKHQCENKPISRNCQDYLDDFRPFTIEPI